jgi:hypothetical protein
VRPGGCTPIHVVLTDPTIEQGNLSSDEDDDDLAPPLVPGERNSQLAVGYKGDRSYVVRGNNIGVFNHAAGNQVKYYATISKIATTKGKEFKPKEVCSVLDIFRNSRVVYAVAPTGYASRSRYQNGADESE